MSCRGAASPRSGRDANPRVLPGHEYHAPKPKVVPPPRSASRTQAAGRRAPRSAPDSAGKRPCARSPADGENGAPGEMKTFSRTAQGHRRLGRKSVLQNDAAGASPTHAERAPVIGQHDAGRGQEKGEMQRLPGLGRIVAGRRGERQRSRRRAAGERLARADAKTAFNLLHRPASVQPVARPRRDENRLLRDDALQERQAGAAAAMVMQRRRDKMLMHRQSQRGDGR